MPLSVRSLVVLTLLVLLSGCQKPELPPLSEAELKQVAALIYRNECGSNPSYLTSWNRGEEFASLGIGHFIWYPHKNPDKPQRFHESFPELLLFLQESGTALPAWLQPVSDAPWQNRSEFMQALDSPKMLELRQLLQSTMPQQARFMQRRMLYSLNTMSNGLSSEKKQHLRRQFMRIAASPMGYYALIDYVNFKGEGVRASERYHGQGWGLRQVLLAMYGEEPGLGAIREMSAAAMQLLTQRTRLAPKERHEERWLPGWRKRLHTYVDEAGRFQQSQRAVSDL